jgi:transposase-like protein
MSSKKITDADKLEIVDLYRSGDTTASLANRYGVSNSTIGRILKSTIPEAEYESLIDRKRNSKASNDKELLLEIDPTQISPALVIDTAATAPVESPLPAIDLDSIVESSPVIPTAPDLGDSLRSPAPIPTSDNSDTQNRRVRRRSSAPVSNQQIDLDPLPAMVENDRSLAKPSSMEIVSTPDPETAATRAKLDLSATEFTPKPSIPPPIPRTPVLREILADSHDRYTNPPVAPVLEIVNSTEENEEDNEPEDVNALAAMFGEEIAENDDEEEEEDSDTEDWAEEPDASDRLLTADRLHVRVKPLSQATLPRTCYIVIDKFAELIVRPLKDFADLGQISGEETQQRTLPVFDNPRVAKRFSNQRTQRVIKVPDSRVFYKTTQHLKSKGIACLLIDGNIYSLN